MKKCTILIVLLAIISGSTIAQNSWTSKQSLPFALAVPSSFSIGNYGYIVGGSGVNNYSNSTFQYDPANDSWTQKADAGSVLRAVGVGFSVNGKGYVGMGLNNIDSVLNDLLQFDPVANTWTSKANIPQKRFAATVMVNGTKVFVACGSPSDYTGAVLDDMWEYNVTTNTWTSRAVFPGGGRYAACGFSCNGSCYLFGGADSDIVNFYSDLWSYNSGTNSWSRMSDLPAAARAFATGFSIGNYCYAGTGSDISNDYTDFWRYDPANDIWLITNPLGTSGRDGAFSFVINNTGYVGGGEDSLANPLDDFWSFVPDSNIYVPEIKSIKASVTIGPNPVGSNATFTVTSSQPLSNPFFRIYNSSGIEVNIIQMKTPATVVNFSAFNSGTYYFALFSNNQLIKSGKFLILHSE